jgi:hypothetical protein
MSEIRMAGVNDPDLECPDLPLQVPRGFHLASLENAIVIEASLRTVTADGKSHFYGPSYSRKANAVDAPSAEFINSSDVHITRLCVGRSDS